jgi:hypothetical protein
MEETSASLAGIAPTASGEYPGPAHYPVLRDVARTLRDVTRPLGASDRAEQLIGDIDGQITVMRSRRDVGAAGREHGSLGGASAQRLFRQELEKGDLYPNLRRSGQAAS